MNHTELAFVNQQLADMLRCGIPLEGGLRQLCQNMNRGRLRKELQLRAQRTPVHGRAQLPQAALQRDATTQHVSQLLIDKGQFGVVHAPKSLRHSASLLMPAATSARAAASKVCAT